MVVSNSIFSDVVQPKHWVNFNEMCTKVCKLLYLECTLKPELEQVAQYSKSICCAKSYHIQNIVLLKLHFNIKLMEIGLGVEAWEAVSTLFFSNATQPNSLLIGFN